MNKSSARRIKNSLLIFWFSSCVFIIIIISLVVKTYILISQSTFDNYHQFIVDIKENNTTHKLIVFNPTSHNIAILEVHNVKNAADISHLPIPIDAQYIQNENKQAPLSSILFTMMFHCWYPQCNNMNTIDAIKLYFFTQHIHQDAIESTSVSFPLSQTTITTVLPTIFIDDALYHEALSISIINASGESGIGNLLSQRLTTVGANIVSVTSGDIQQNSSVQVSNKQAKYSLQRLQKILKIPFQLTQTPGISDIIITIGKKHPIF